MSAGNQVPQRTKEVVRERAGGRCEVCGKYAPGADIHHRLSKGMGGTSNKAIHDASNLLAVCGWGNTSGCHGDIHGNGSFAKAMGHTVSRHTRYSPLQIPVRMFDGMWWLNDDGTRTAAVGDEVRA